jgi:hypothetical protein
VRRRGIFCPLSYASACRLGWHCHTRSVSAVIAINAIIGLAVFITVIAAIAFSIIAVIVAVVGDVIGDVIIGSACGRVTARRDPGSIETAQVTAVFADTHSAASREPSTKGRCAVLREEREERGEWVRERERDTHTQTERDSVLSVPGHV